MTRKLFRSLDRSGVEYLLISGQASVLYGGAQFSENVDLWIRPTARNVGRLIKALTALRARVHKLTPPMSLRNLNRGHGFHFVIPDLPSVYLDLMGVPPRAPSFEEAASRAVVMDSDWGRLPVAALVDLIEVKKTRRLADYEIISNLTEIRMQQSPDRTKALLRWAVRNSFRFHDRLRYLRALGIRKPESAVRSEIAREIVRLQKRDEAYWRPIVAELRRFRRTGKLLPAGTLVAGLRLR